MSVDAAVPYFRKITGKMTGNVKFITLAGDTTTLDTA